jgi:two-component system, OmpR family, phosphate regulon sensor histidine kinase PhoR
VSRSLYWKITVPFTLFILVGMSLLGLYIVDIIRKTQTAELESQLIIEAKLVAEVSLPDFIEPDKQNGLEIIAKTIGNEIETRITLIGINGTVLGDSDEDLSALDNHSTRPEVKTALSGKIGRSIRYSASLNENMMYVAIPVIEQDQIIGIARVALPLTKVESLVNKTIASIVGAIIIAAIFVILITALVSRMITRPVRQLTIAAEEIASGKLGRTLTIQTNDEIGRLGRVFNEMSSNLLQSIGQISSEKTKLQTVMGNMADGVAVVDGEGKIILANRTTEKLFSFREQDMINKPLIEVVKDHEIDALLWRCLRNHQGETTQLESGTPKRFLRVIAVPVRDDKQNGVLVLFQDLTELKSLQTMRRELVGNISHELRTPLAGIKAMVETIQGDAINDKEVTQDFLTRINGEIDRLTQMVSELTELSRIETGKADFSMGPIDINLIVGEVIAQMSPLAERIQVNINANLDTNLPSAIADRERIRQTLVNLVHNAVKFNHPGGTVTVSTSTDSKSVIVGVSDTGIGISADDLPHIFDRFYKSDKARSKGGSGLGLAIAKYTIQAHGSNILVQSEEGKGSTFTFSLPLKENADTKNP